MSTISSVSIARNLVVFARALRGSGIAVDPGQIVDLQRAIELIEATDGAQFYHAARAIFVRRLEDLALFDRAFALFWRDLGNLDLVPNPRPHGSQADRTVRIELPDAGPGDALEDAEDEKLAVTQPSLGAAERLDADDRASPRREQLMPIRTYSAAEALREKDFSRLTQAELEDARALLQRLRWRVGTRRTRRTRAAASGARLDLRASIRESLRTGGELTRLAWRQQKTKVRPLVILGDVSGSMDRYTRLLLQFFYAVRRGRADVEVFVFGTRLTRITHDLGHRDVDEAMHGVAAHVVDWSGGTRIGEALHAFHRGWARRVLGRGAVTIVVSDGWDRGDVGLLRREIERLQRRSFRLIWLNPLLGLGDYEPATAGMRAALPYIDDFLPAHNLASLEDLANRLANLEDRRPVRRSSQALR